MDISIVGGKWTPMKNKSKAIQTIEGENSFMQKKEGTKGES